MKVKIWTQAYFKKTDVIPTKYQDDLDEHLAELARVKETPMGVMLTKELADLIDNLIEIKDDKAFVDALRKILGVCRDNSVNELIFE